MASNFVLVEPPDDCNAAVIPLPDGQNPFGDDCTLDRKIQSVFHHYEVDSDVANHIAEEGFKKIKDIRMADPDGNEEQRALFNSVTKCQNTLTVAVIRSAFRRLLRPNPYAAIVVQPPVETAKLSTSSTSALCESTKPSKPILARNYAFLSSKCAA